MGNDDLYRKRKFHKIKSFRRSAASRDPYDRVLIVCEGQKTEPAYFKELRKYFRLNPVNVVIADRGCGLDPKRLVEYAIEEFNKSRDFDHVYCVFDRDKHPSFDEALNKIRSTTLKKATIRAITSTPCFELWLLLHFKYTTRPFGSAGNDSNCALVVSDLKNHIPNYEKGNSNIFSTVSDKLDTAVKNAKQLAEYHKTSGTSNPSTDVYLLVEYLESLKR